MNNIEKALLLIASVRAALANGIIHRSIKSGKVLKSADEVVKALHDDGEVDLDFSKRVQVTTEEEELAKMTPTGRARSQPNLQDIPLLTEEVALFRAILTGKGMG